MKYLEWGDYSFVQTEGRGVTLRVGTGMDEDRLPLREEKPEGRGLGVQQGVLSVAVT